MKHIISGQMTDQSDPERFCFSLTCTECRSEWRSTPSRFSKAGEAIQTEARRIITKAMYQREHKQAKEHALCESVQHFNICPLCHGLVCNYCFVICEDLDMCCSCAQTLEQHGEAVMASPLQPAYS